MVNFETVTSYFPHFLSIPTLQSINDTEDGKSEVPWSDSQSPLQKILIRFYQTKLVPGDTECASQLNTYQVG